MKMPGVFDWQPVLSDIEPPKVVFLNPCFPVYHLRRAAFETHPTGSILTHQVTRKDLIIFIISSLCPQGSEVGVLYLLFPLLTPCGVLFLPTNPTDSSACPPGQGQEEQECSVKILLLSLSR